MQESNMWLATALFHEPVRNNAGESLGKIEDIVIDSISGTIQYAVLSPLGAVGTGNKLFAIPWSLLHTSPERDYIVLNFSRETLERAPGFYRGQWPDFRDPAWRQSMYNYYGTAPGGIPAAPVPERTVIPERQVYVRRERVEPVRPARRGMSFAAGLVTILLILGLGWMTFLVSTRGWEQVKQDFRSSMQGAAYAAKETSLDAALKTKVKTALALSKSVPSSRIDVDTAGDLVTLRGDVPSEDAKTKAASIAQDVPGVREVQNHLFVTSRTQ